MIKKKTEPSVEVKTPLVRAPKAVPVKTTTEKEDVSFGSKRVGTESKEVEGDFLEISIKIQASVGYQTVGANYTWKTSNPDYIPLRGTSPEQVKQKIVSTATIVAEAATGELDDVFDLAHEMSMKAKSLS